MQRTGRQEATRLVLGCAFGFSTSLVNHGFGPHSDHVSKLLGNGWSWLVAGLVAGLFASNWRSASRLVMYFLLPAVWCYYAADTRAGTYATLGGSVDVLNLVSDLFSYSVIGALASIGLGYLASRIKRGGLKGLLAGLLLPAYITYTAWRVHGHSTHDPVSQDVTVWVMTAGVLTMVLYAIWFCTKLQNQPGRCDNPLSSCVEPSCRTLLHRAGSLDGGPRSKILDIDDSNDGVY